MPWSDEEILPGFPSLGSTIDPDGRQRLTELSPEARELAEAFLALDPREAGAARLPEDRTQFRPYAGKTGAEENRYYQPFGEFVPGETPQVRRPDGSIVPLPRDWAYHRESNQIYAIPETGLQRFTLLPIGVNRAGETEPATPGFVMSALEALDKAYERMRMGLEVPQSVLVREAIDVGGLGSSLTFGGRGALNPSLSREAAERLRQADAPAAVPPSAPAPVPAAPATAGLPQARTRPASPATVQALAARTEAQRQARLRADMPEMDDAGFFINALERGKRELPERATANEMYEALRQVGVEPAEAQMLGLDRFLLGEAGVAREALRSAEREMSRLGTVFAKAARKAKDFPDNTAYASGVRNAREQLIEARRNVAGIRRTAQNASVAHMRDAMTQFHNAERYLKSVNNEIRTVRKEMAAAGKNDLSDLRSVEWPGVNLLDERITARQSLAEARKLMDDARSQDPGLRIVTRQEVLDHIRANRPQLDVYARYVPENFHGAMEEPIKRIREGSVFEHELMQRGVAYETAADIQMAFRGLDVTEWGQRAAALSSHMENPTVVREALEAAAGARLADMALAARGRHASQAGVQRPKYRQAVPDRDNPTMAEVAFVLKGPWSERTTARTELQRLIAERDQLFHEYSAAPKGSSREADGNRLYDELTEQIRNLEARIRELPKPPYVRHWPDDLAPIGHMQVTMQRTVKDLSEKASRQREFLGRRMAKLRDEQAAIDQKINGLDITHAEETVLVARRNRIDKDITDLERRMPTSEAGDQIFMGNQFQSDWAVAGAQGFLGPDVAARIAALNKRIAELDRLDNVFSDQLARLRKQSENRGAIMPREYRSREMDDPWNRLQDDIKDIEKELRRIHNDRYKLGDLVRELQTKPEGHALVMSTRSWLRPVLEQFVDAGLRSGARYLGVPSGSTVRTWNPGTEGINQLYDNMLRDELRFVMKRRGLPVSDPKRITTMFSPDGDKSFNGEWFLIELPQNARRGRGVRLMAQPGIPAVPEAEEQNGQAR